MKFKSSIMIAVITLILMPVTVYGSQTYISDSAGVLSSSTLNKVETNLAKSKSTFIFLGIFILILITYIIKRKVYRS